MFSQILATNIQSWTDLLPNSSNSAGLLDMNRGLLILLGKTLAGQSSLDSMGHNTSNSLINFWYNLRDGLLKQTLLIQSLLDQGYMTRGELAELINKTQQAFMSVRSHHPCSKSIITALKISLGVLSANNLQQDSSYQWTLLFLLFFAISSEPLSNKVYLEILYNYLFQNSLRPAILLCIDDPTIIRLLPPTTIPSDYIQLSDNCLSDTQDLCPNIIAWHSNHVSDTHQKICRKNKMTHSCIFPNATSLILNTLARDAKQTIQNEQESLDSIELQHILKKVLVISMFTGAQNCHELLNDTNNGGKLC